MMEACKRAKSWAHDLSCVSHSLGKLLLEIIVLVLALLRDNSALSASRCACPRPLKPMHTTKVSSPAICQTAAVTWCTQFLSASVTHEKKARAEGRGMEGARVGKGGWGFLRAKLKLVLAYLHGGRAADLDVCEDTVEQKEQPDILMLPQRPYTCCLVSKRYISKRQRIEYTYTFIASWATRQGCPKQGM